MWPKLKMATSHHYCKKTFTGEHWSTKTVYLFFMQQVIQIPIPCKPLRIGPISKWHLWWGMMSGIKSECEITILCHHHLKRRSYTLQNTVERYLPEHWKLWVGVVLNAGTSYFQVKLYVLILKQWQTRVQLIGHKSYTRLYSINPIVDHYYYIILLLWHIHTVHQTSTMFIFNIQIGPKKCIHSLLINIFGINLNEISISGWECNIMFSQQMAQALL